MILTRIPLKSLSNLHPTCLVQARVEVHAAGHPALVGIQHDDITILLEAHRDGVLHADLRHHDATAFLLLMGHIIINIS